MPKPKNITQLTLDEINEEIDKITNFEFNGGGYGCPDAREADERKLRVLMKLREQKIKENSSKKETLDYMEENNDTKLLDEFKDDVLTLSYKDKDHLDRIRRKGKMLIQNIHGKESEYLGDFDKISFYARVAPVEESYKRECWEGGKNAIINLINTMLEELAIFGTKKNILTENNKLNNNNRIFIVHGRDSAAKIEVARFIEKLGFEAIILHEQASSGKTIIEKIEEHSN